VGIGLLIQWSVAKIAAKNQIEDSGRLIKRDPGASVLTELAPVGVVLGRV
jgi:hypothetical protein